MSDRLTSQEVEDVLSSVRRLVAKRAEAEPETEAEDEALEAEKLLLTPSLRVEEIEARDEDVSEAPEHRVGDGRASEEAILPQGVQSLEDRIAELEAAVTGQVTDWEPDGSENLAGEIPNAVPMSAHFEGDSDAQHETDEKETGDAEAASEEPEGPTEPTMVSLDAPSQQTAEADWQTEVTASFASDIPETPPAHAPEAERQADTDKHEDAGEAGAPGDDAEPDAPVEVDAAAATSEASDDDTWDLEDASGGEDARYAPHEAEAAADDGTDTTAETPHEAPTEVTAVQEGDTQDAADLTAQPEPVFAHARSLDEALLADPPVPEPDEVNDSVETPEDLAEDGSGLDLDAAGIDEDLLRDMVAEIVRDELQGELGERITRNVRKLVRREIQRALATGRIQ